jgi:hypothetical protein
MFGTIWAIGSLISIVVGFIVVGFKKTKSFTYDPTEGAMIAFGVGLFWWFAVPAYLLYRLGCWIGEHESD